MLEDDYREPRGCTEGGKLRSTDFVRESSWTCLFFFQRMKGLRWGSLELPLSMDSKDSQLPLLGVFLVPFHFMPLLWVSRLAGTSGHLPHPCVALDTKRWWKQQWFLRLAREEEGS